MPFILKERLAVCKHRMNVAEDEMRFLSFVEKQPND